MRLGRVVFNMGYGYVVNLDNEEMVQHAKDCMYEDVMSMVKYNDLASAIDTVEDSNVKEDQIPDFLTEDRTDYLEDIKE